MNTQEQENEKQPAPEEKKETAPRRLVVGIGKLLTLEGTPGLVGAFVLGFLLGAGLALYAVLQLQQPAFLVKPWISFAVSATVAAQPTATPAPTYTPCPAPVALPTSAPPMIVKVYNAKGQEQVLRGECYVADAGAFYRIQVAYSEDRNFKFSANCGEDEEFEVEGIDEAAVGLTVPNSGRAMCTVKVCPQDAYGHCKGRELPLTFKVVGERD